MNWIKTNYKTLIISAFVIPIIIVAAVSISHVTQWYGISNPFSWAIYLSIGVEIAAMSSLAAISARMGKSVYFPFIVVTLIQFVGNIFFSFKFIDINSVDFKSWVDLVSPLFSYMGVEPKDLLSHKRILSLISGGLLPIISLTFLHMLVKYTEDNHNVDETIIPKTTESVVENNDTTEDINEIETIEEKKDQEVINALNNVEKIIDEKTTQEPVKDVLDDITVQDLPLVNNEEVNSIEETPTPENKSSEDDKKKT